MDNQPPDIFEIAAASNCALSAASYELLIEVARSRDEKAIATLYRRHAQHSDTLRWELLGGPGAIGIFRDSPQELLKAVEDGTPDTWATIVNQVCSAFGLDDPDIEFQHTDAKVAAVFACLLAKFGPHERGRRLTEPGNACWIVRDDAEHVATVVAALDKLADDPEWLERTLEQNSDDSTLCTVVAHGLPLDHPALRSLPWALPPRQNITIQRDIEIYAVRLVDIVSTTLDTAAARQAVARLAVDWTGTVGGLTDAARLLVAPELAAAS